MYSDLISGSLIEIGAPICVPIGVGACDAWVGGCYATVVAAALHGTAC